MLSARPVEGRYRRMRWWANAGLIAVLVGVPWIRFGGEPLILLDIPARTFHVFGLLIFPQELYFLWVILAVLAISLFFFTALAGRLWCGWACPQTVFTDVFAAIARRIQGWRGHRPPRHIAPWRHVATHSVWIALCLIIGFHLVGYFRSPYVMVEEIASGTLSRTAGSFLVVMAALSYFDFVIVKQTFCKFLCPYARFQGVLFDSDTLVVGYDASRGEPRGKVGKVAGDCVDCDLCVQVCPTGIDIRDGMQMECIACTQCIDACNGVMDRTDREAGLIDYRSLVSLEGTREARILRPRVVVYAVLMLLGVVAFAGLLSRRLPMDLHVAHNRAQLYATAADGRVGNSFTLHIENRDRADHAFRIRLEESARYELIAGVNPISVPAASSAQARVFVLANEGADSGDTGSIRFVLEQVGQEDRKVVRPTRFVGSSGGRSHGG